MINVKTLQLLSDNLDKMRDNLLNERPIRDIDKSFINGKCEGLDLAIKQIDEIVKLALKAENEKE